MPLGSSSGARCTTTCSAPELNHTSAQCGAWPALTWHAGTHGIERLLLQCQAVRCCAATISHHLHEQGGLMHLDEIAP